MGGDGFDVSGQQGFGIGGGQRRHQPIRVVLVPKQGVAAHLDAAPCGEGHQRVGAFPVPFIRLGTQYAPFERPLGSDDPALV